MSTEKKRFGWPTIVGVIVTIPILWWSLRGIHFAEVFEYFREARKAPLIGAMIAVAAAIPVRAARWRVLLRRENPYLPLAPLYLATSAGFAINNLLPARAGEIARAYAARRLTGVRFSAAITTILMSRVFDGVTLFLILALASFLGALAPDFTLAGVTVARIMQVATVVFAALFVLAAVATRFPEVFLSGARKVSHIVLPDKLADRIVQGLHGILDSLAVVGSLRALAVVMGWSAAIWAINGVSIVLGFIAFDLAVPWHGAFVMQSLVNFGLAIPSTPGFVGVFEALIRASLSIYGVPAAEAISFAVAYHFCSYAPLTVIGLWSLTRARIRMSEVQEEVHERVSGAVQRLTGTFHGTLEAPGK
jgi:uncharacterized protein (TIRG00374 family)